MSHSIPVLFLVIVAISLGIFYRASRKSARLLFIVAGWAIIQSLLAVNGFYEDSMTLPPHFIWAIGPPVITILILLLTNRGQRFLHLFDLTGLTLLHVVRVPVELVLYSLMTQRLIPVIMTFEGMNFDIVMGLSAPLVYRYGFKSAQPRRWILVWNIAGLLSVLSVVTIGILSAPTRIQQLSFEQPNLAIAYFPYILLPAVIVPLVLFAHAAAIIRLLRHKA